MKRLLFLLFAVVATSACKSDDSEPNTSDYDRTQFTLSDFDDESSIVTNRDTWYISYNENLTVNACQSMFNKISSLYSDGRKIELFFETTSGGNYSIEERLFFNQMGISGITIEGCSTIGDYAFSEMSNLGYLTLYDATTLGDYILNNNNIYSLYLLSDQNITLSNDTFANFNSENCRLQLDESKLYGVAANLATTPTVEINLATWGGVRWSSVNSFEYINALYLADFDSHELSSIDGAEVIICDEGTITANALAPLFNFLSSTYKKFEITFAYATKFDDNAFGDYNGGIQTLIAPEVTVLGSNSFANLAKSAIINMHLTTEDKITVAADSFDGADMSGTNLYISSTNEADVEIDNYTWGGTAWSYINDLRRGIVVSLSDFDSEGLFTVVTDAQYGCFVFDDTGEITRDQTKNLRTYLSSKDIIPTTELSFPYATSFGDNALYNTAIYTLEAALVTELGESAFEGSSLGYVTLPKLKTIGKRAFADVTSLGSFESATVESVGDEAFADCDEGWFVITLSGATEFGSNIFSGSTNVGTLVLTAKGNFTCASDMFSSSDIIGGLELYCDKGSESYFTTLMSVSSTSTSTVMRSDIELSGSSSSIYSSYKELYPDLGTATPATTSCYIWMGHTFLYISLLDSDVGVIF